ncbi:ecdysteroid 22-kinase family protein [Pseudomonas citronellolis]|uniref:ecdysteroid 22-kinase family protein n=1 Tax=Pseudomonas citronellolis TaxID=53408 RepID=UPI0021C112DE|nr:ecdysteroid 22-kinase family protein [Pseudomonas citronellolis]UXJ50251.1 ecdysteroid 22-kinase family protein [Pseudomonas citronellolis]
MRLPLKVEEITAEWIEAALNIRFPGVGIASCQVSDVMLGTSTKVRIELEYNRIGHALGLPATMIVKGGFEEHSPSMGFMYAKEARTYGEVLPLWDITAPRCFFAGSDEDSYQSLILMEDLNARGVTFCHAQKPQSYAQLSRRLRAMARYHAQMWEHPAFGEGGALAWIEPRMTGDTLVYADRYLQPEVWQHYIGSPRGAAISRRLHDLEWMRGAFGKLAELHRRHPLTLSHGDTHLGNLYEEADGTPGFFDMQVNRAPWFADVTYHLICALDLMDRRDWERSLLRYYLDCLGAEGVAAPDFDEAWDCYRKEIAWGLFVFIINETRFQTEAVNTAYCARFADAALCHDTLSLLS